jgi:hypothetical protein
MFQTHLVFALALLVGINGFAPASLKSVRSGTGTSLFADKAAKEVTGEELELMLEDWEQPLVLDAYATWVRFIPNTACCMSIA